MSQPDSKDPDYAEVDAVLPPDPLEQLPTGEETIPRSPIAKLLSYVLDECIRIPGTKIKIGLDPILGLIPGGGEAVASVLGSLIVGEAYKKGLPLKTVFGMAKNLLVNATVGSIPGLGDLFSAWFKSNKKNYGVLVEQMKDGQFRGKERPVWPIVLGLTVLVLCINALSFFLMWNFVFTPIKAFLAG